MPLSHVADVSLIPHVRGFPACTGLDARGMQDLFGDVDIGTRTPRFLNGPWLVPPSAGRDRKGRRAESGTADRPHSAQRLTPRLLPPLRRARRRGGPFAEASAELTSPGNRARWTELAAALTFATAALAGRELRRTRLSSRAYVKMTVAVIVGFILQWIM